MKRLLVINKPANSGLGDLGQLIGALSDWVPIFEALDQAAPPGIEPDVHNILDSLRRSSIRPSARAQMTAVTRGHISIQSSGTEKEGF